jgi:hypothetical protein
MDMVCGEQNIGCDTLKHGLNNFLSTPRITNPVPCLDDFKAIFRDHGNIANQI